MARFTFVDVLPNDAPARSKEVRNSEIRAHAARIGHLRHAKKLTRSRAKVNAESLKLQLPVGGARQILNRKDSQDSDGGWQAFSPHSNTSSSGEDDETGLIERFTTTQVERSRHGAHRTEPIYIVQLQTELDKITRMFWQVCAPSSMHFCNALRVKNIKSQEWLDLLVDDAMFHVGAGLVKYEHNKLINPESPSPKEVSFHKTEALKVIMRRLQESGGILDNTTLIAIVFLPFIDDLPPNRQTYIAHWAALAGLLAARLQRGSIERSPGGVYATAVIEQMRVFCKFHAGISLPTEKPISNRPAELPRIPTSVLPHGIQTIVEQNLLSHGTVHLAHNLAELLSTSGSLQPRGDEIRTTSFQDKWSLWDLKAGTVPNEPSIDEVVTVALAVYHVRSAGVLSMLSSQPKGARSHLAMVLTPSVTERPIDEEHALFWAWTVSVESWKTRLDVLTSDGKRLRDMQAKRFPWCSSLETAKQVLQKFFWDDELLKNYERFMQPYMDR